MVETRTRRVRMLGPFVCGLLCILLTIPHATQAITVLFTATDVPDTTPGEDRWQYTYAVSDFPFPAMFGFDIFFRLADGYQFGDLDTTPPSPNADWDVTILQPDPGLPDDGRYEAVALADVASLDDPFLIGFIWRGSGTPGAQRFEVFDTTFDVVASGNTTSGQIAPVPEPGTMVLIVTGLVVLCGLKRYKVACAGDRISTTITHRSTAICMKEETGA